MLLKIFVFITFVVMLLVNGLANALPINDLTTGQVSEMYPNLFAPAGYTFAIWGLIYFLLALYTLFQLGLFQPSKSKEREELLKKIGPYFALSSIANTLWIFSWHYLKIEVSVLLMFVILICLILIVSEIKKVDLSIRENIYIRTPFSVYFGWITVATIANVTTYLVSIGWDGFGISEVVWTIIVLVLGFIIGAVTIIQNDDIAYGLVILWAYIGILVKHISKSEFAGQYIAVIITVSICILLIILLLLYQKKLMASYKSNARKITIDKS